MWMDLGKDILPNNEENTPLKTKFFIYMFEKCVKKMDENNGVYEFVWIFNTKNMSLSLSLIKQIKELIVQIGDVYNERLGKSIVLNLSWYLNLLWLFMKPFLQKTTVDKYIFLTGSDEEIKKKLLEYVEEKEISIETKTY
eukprot:EC826079.1.p1 GENE.EC826079.1~~EC826079.1.p1  ORF type:complete len:140 (+),score=57.68 EC826079.1:352-771(+)